MAVLLRSNPAFAQSTTSFRGNLTDHAEARTLLILAICLLAAQLGLIAALLMRRSKLRLMGDALRSAEARQVAMLRALPGMLFVLNREGRYLNFYAPEGSALSVPEGLLGRHLRDVMPPDLAARFEQAFAQALDSREPMVTEYALDLESGRAEFEARIVCCGDDKLLSIVRDVTARKASERALTRSEAALRDSHRHSQTLAARLILAQDSERQRIARDLHDDLGQKLAVLNMEMTQLALNASPEVQYGVKELSNLVSEIAEEVHDLSHQLHPSRPEVLGLVPALRSLCDDLSRQHEIAVDFHALNMPPTIDSAVSLCVYRIVQEALHNVVKHSGARRARVGLKGRGAGLDLVVADEGRGFVANENELAGLGVLSMRERVKLLGGEIHIRSAPGSGVRLDVRLPPVASASGAPAVDEQRST